MKKNKWWPLTDEEFEDLIAQVDNGNSDDYFVENAVDPKDELEAIKLTIAKWHPNRDYPGGSNNCGSPDSCGCCMYYADCSVCILNRGIVGAVGCCGEGIAFKYACKRLVELTE